MSKITTKQIKNLRNSQLFEDTPVPTPNKHSLDSTTGDGSDQWWGLVEVHRSGRPTGKYLVVESESCPLDDGTILNPDNYVASGEQPFCSDIEAEKFIEETVGFDEDGWFQWK